MKKYIDASAFSNVLSPLERGQYGHIYYCVLRQIHLYTFSLDYLFDYLFKFEDDQT